VNTEKAFLVAGIGGFLAYKYLNRSANPALFAIGSTLSTPTKEFPSLSYTSPQPLEGKAGSSKARLTLTLRNQGQQDVLTKMYGAVVPSGGSVVQGNLFSTTALTTDHVTLTVKAGSPLGFTMYTGDLSPAAAGPNGYDLIVYIQYGTKTDSYRISNAIKIPLTEGLIVIEGITLGLA